MGQIGLSPAAKKGINRVATGYFPEYLVPNNRRKRIKARRCQSEAISGDDVLLKIVNAAARAEKRVARSNDQAVRQRLSGNKPWLPCRCGLAGGLGLNAV